MKRGIKVNNLETSLRVLRRDFEENVAPVVKRHQHHRSKSQMRKEKKLIKAKKAN